MMTFRKTVGGLSALAMAVVLVGCGGAPVAAVEPVGVHPQQQGLPSWATRGGAAFPEDKGKAIYGVGMVSKVSMPALATRAAGSRAREEIARVLNTFVASVMKDYMQSALSGQMDQDESGQVIESVSQSITRTTLVGAEIVDTFYHERFDTWYALAKLEMNNIAMQLEKELKQVQETKKIKMDAEKAHAQLTEIINSTAASMY